MNSFGKEIGDFEGKAETEPVILHLADGSRRTVSGDPAHWFALIDAWRERSNAEDAGQPVPASPLSDELDAIRDAIRVDEPDGHMYDLLSAILRSPSSPGNEEVQKGNHDEENR
jgi:hypothetical protein